MSSDVARQGRSVASARVERRRTDEADVGQRTSSVERQRRTLGRQRGGRRQSSRASTSSSSFRCRTVTLSSCPTATPTYKASATVQISLAVTVSSYLVSRNVLRGGLHKSGVLTDGLKNHLALLDISSVLTDAVHGEPTLAVDGGQLWKSNTLKKA